MTKAGRLRKPTTGTAGGSQGGVHMLGSQRGPGILTLQAVQLPGAHPEASCMAVGLQLPEIC